MSYTPYNPDLLEPMFFRTFNIKPYVFDTTKFSIYELVSSALGRINEVIKEINDVGEAIVLFEKYVIEELSKYDSKIQTEVKNFINSLIANGTIADLINNTILLQVNTDITNLKTNVNDLLYKYPVTSLSIMPTKQIYEFGETVNGVILNVTLTNKFLPIQEVKYYKNNVLINTKTITGSSTSDTFIDANNITQDTEYYIEITDGKNIVQSNKILINFVYPIYVGGLNESITKPTQTDVKSKIKFLLDKGNLEIHATYNNEKVMIAYLSSYGDLSSIRDYNNTNISWNFIKDIINVDMLDGTTKQCNVYSTEYPVTISNFPITFRFEG